MTFTDRAVVLSRERWREYDKRVMLLTRDHGKFDAIAIGAARITSKLAGHLEPLRSIDVMIAEGARMHKVAQAQTRESFAHTCDAVRVAMLGTIVRFVDRATARAVVDAELFTHVESGLYALAHVARADRDTMYGVVLQNLAHHFGYAPEFSHCVLCEKKSDVCDGGDFKKFSASHGGVVCDACHTDDACTFDADPARRHAYITAALAWRGFA